MSELTITLEQSLQLRDKGALLIDARSPAEYAEATIPGAINVPVFSNTERTEVGTIYKQVGKEEAQVRGVELVAPKIPAMLTQVRAALTDSNPPVIVFCWRGGMRSKALTSFLDLAGIPARQMIGGHKAFRRKVLDYFEHENWGRMLVLRGLTGVGKTRTLQQLDKAGHPTVDLEGLANHRGSAFGNLGLPPQPSQKMFEALLWDKLRRFGPDDYVIAEGESRHIGRVALPVRVYRALQPETTLWLTASLEQRTNIILDDYPDPDQYYEGFFRQLSGLRERLGSETVTRLLEQLNNGAWRKLVKELMTLYYDPLYRHTQPADRVEISLDNEEQALTEISAAVERILATPKRAIT